MTTLYCDFKYRKIGKKNSDNKKTLILKKFLIKRESKI